MITSDNRHAAATQLADVAQIKDRVDILSVEQFVSTNLLEWSRFNRSGAGDSLRQLVERYNEIVASVETDGSLRIELS